MAATETAETPVFAEAPARVAVLPLRPALPVLGLVAGTIVGLTAAHGGYFPTSWGLTATLLLWAVSLWLVLSARTDAGRLDLVFLGLLVAFAAWVGLSISWSLVPAQSVLDLERTVVLVAGITCMLAFVRREDVPRLTGVVLGSIAAVCTYSLATRLFPERLGTFDPVAGNRLSDPLGYWNTLGVFAAMGTLLSVGIVTDAKARWSRAAAAAPLVLLVVTLYYTYSRGAWLALATGLGVMLVVSPRRLKAVATLAVVAVPACVAVLLAARPYALTHADVKLADTSAAGHRLAPVLLLLAVATALLVLALDVAERRVTVGRGVRLVLGGALIGAVAVSATAFVVEEGGPAALARHGWRSFSAAPTNSGNNLNARLFSFSGSGRVEVWRAARDEYESHRVTGGGAGTFERTWQARRDARFKVRDAHSLYVETLGELGPVGLALLVLFLLVPVAAALPVRKQAFLPVLLAAYVAFVVHAGVDWDWELSGVTVTALVIGALSVVSVRPRETRALAGGVRVPAAILLLVVSLGMIGAFLGNAALSRAQDAVTSRSYDAAVEDANRARRLMPWSPWPLIARGDAQLGLHDSKAAATSYRRAISIDSGEWRAWLGLAYATRGRERRAALAEARRLYPTSPAVDLAAARLKMATNN